MTTKTILAAMLLLFSSHAWADIRCARLDGKDTILEYRTFGGVDVCPPDLPQKGWRWLPAPEAVKPASDPAKVITGPTVTVGKDAVTTGYTVRDKTPQELAADADASKEKQLSGLDLVLQLLCDHESRIRVLEGKTALTFDQCRAAIKSKLQ